jgi:hypothetical protein
LLSRLVRHRMLQDNSPVCKTIWGQRAIVLQSRSRQPAQAKARGYGIFNY